MDQWREALVNYDSTINTSLDADIYIYEELFVDKNHTIDKVTGQRKPDVEWDDDDVWDNVWVDDDGEYVVDDGEYVDDDGEYVLFDNDD